MKAMKQLWGIWWLILLSLSCSTMRQKDKIKPIFKRQSSIPTFTTEKKDGSALAVDGLQTTTVPIQTEVALQISVTSEEAHYHEFYICSAKNKKNCNPQKSHPNSFAAKNHLFYSSPRGEVLIYVRGCFNSEFNSTNSNCGKWYNTKIELPEIQDPALLSLFGEAYENDKKIKAKAKKVRAAVDRYLSQGDSNDFNSKLYKLAKNHNEIPPEVIAEAYTSGALTDAEIALRGNDQNRKDAEVDEANYGPLALLITGGLLLGSGAAYSAYMWTNAKVSERANNARLKSKVDSFPTFATTSHGAKIDRDLFIKEIKLNSDGTKKIVFERASQGNGLSQSLFAIDEKTGTPLLDETTKLPIQIDPTTVGEGGKIRTGVIARPLYSVDYSHASVEQRYTQIVSTPAQRRKLGVIPSQIPHGSMRWLHDGYIKFPIAALQTPDSSTGKITGWNYIEVPHKAGEVIDTSIQGTIEKIRNISTRNYSNTFPDQKLANIWNTIRVHGTAMITHLKNYESRVALPQARESAVRIALNRGDLSFQNLNPKNFLTTENWIKKFAHDNANAQEIFNLMRQYDLKPSAELAITADGAGNMSVYPKMQGVRHHTSGFGGKPVSTAITAQGIYPGRKVQSSGEMPSIMRNPQFTSEHFKPSYTQKAGSVMHDSTRKILSQSGYPTSMVNSSNSSTFFGKYKTPWQKIQSWYLRGKNAKGLEGTSSDSFRPDNIKTRQAYAPEISKLRVENKGKIIVTGTNETWDEFTKLVNKNHNIRKIEVAKGLVPIVAGVVAITISQKYDDKDSEDDEEFNLVSRSETQLLDHLTEIHNSISKLTVENFLILEEATKKGALTLARTPH